MINIGLQSEQVAAHRTSNNTERGKDIVAELRSIPAKTKSDFKIES